MPSFKKRALSLYLRNGCERQFALYLYNDRELKDHGMPPRQQNRSGLGLVGQAGYEWQDEKVSELKSIFGATRVHENPHGSATRPGEVQLLEVLPKVGAYEFIVEGTYEAETPTFRQSLGLATLVDNFGNEVNIGNTRPDIIQVLPSVTEGVGPETDKRPNPYNLAVLPNGGTLPLEQNDTRLRLRVIDIKLTSEPGANYFAEVTYYSMTLAAWLIERGYDNRFVVVAAPAVWPGSHEASSLARQLAEWRKRAYEPTGSELIAALEEDLELAVFDVFAPRLRTFLTDELPKLLSKPWSQLAWHVDHRCKGCEFLGYPWVNQDGEIQNNRLHCWPTADREGNLSQIFGLSRGGSEHLRSSNVTSVQVLANESASSIVFNDHQGLRGKRSALPHRAQALRDKTTSVIPASGGDALMPKWPALHIYLFLDYDLSSAITASMGVRAFWHEPLPYASQLEPKQRSWPAKQQEDEVFLVDRRDLEQERAEFLRFLRYLASIIQDVRNQDEADAKESRRDTGKAKTPHQLSNYQIYLWDESQRKHLVRLIGRHLPHILGDPQLADLAWLFPPPELLPQAEEATRQSAITLVCPVVTNTVAIDVPHYYRLIDLATKVTPPDRTAPFMHPLYQEPLSDLIPMERLHEYWNKSGNWLEKQRYIIRATQSKVFSLSLVVGWLEKQLENVLSRQAAPSIVKKERNPLSGVSPMSQLWFGFTRLNAAIDELDTCAIRAMPPHEREARLKSARLTRRLEGEDRHEALVHLGKAAGTILADVPTLFVYEMRDGSQEVNVRQGDFQLALSPETSFGFLDEHPFTYVRGTELEGNFYGNSIEDGQLTAVSVAAIDRPRRLIALRASHRNIILELEEHTRLDFSRNVILDPIFEDYLIRKVKLTLSAIKYPASAGADERVLHAMGLPQAKPGKAGETPASEVLWKASQLYTQENDVDITSAQPVLEDFFHSQGAQLNQSQWNAWQEALQRKLSLIWGPPGTGKSRTLRAVILGIVLDAVSKQKPLRLLISSNTYTAIDNVLLDLERELRTLVGSEKYRLYRLQSEWRDDASAEWRAKYPSLENLSLNRMSPSEEILQLREQLNCPTGITILGAPPQQLHNLAIAGSKNPRPAETLKNWFDFIMIDEASQVDVATSALVFSKRAEGGTCVLAGDDLQLPPIHQAEPPKDLESVVGSLYNYFRNHHGITPCSLDVNYRSNETIVEFVRTAGYSDALQSYSPNLRLDFVHSIGDEKPPDWPATLFWSPNWKEFLDPDYPTVSFVYEDILSSQANQFEADSVAALTWLLRRNLAGQLLKDQHPDGTMMPRSAVLYDEKRFWERAVGVVTPHRAQMAKVVSQLRQVFPNDSVDAIYGAVDTVERYQGQQRDVIIASFGLGDPDIIRAEDEFLFNLNRFNVLASRARAKIIVFATKSLLQYLSDDVRILEESQLLKRYIESFCSEPYPMRLGYLKGEDVLMRDGVVRRHSSRSEHDI